MSIDKPSKEKQFTSKDIFFKSKEGGYSFRANTLSQFLDRNGFAIHKEGESGNYGGVETYIKDSNNVLSEVNNKEVFRIVRDLLRDSKRWTNAFPKKHDVKKILDDVLDEWAEQGLNKSLKGMNNLEVITDDDIRIFQDRQNVAFITFEADVGVVVITNKKIELTPYSKLSIMGKDKIWKNQLLQICKGSHQPNIDKRDRVKDNRSGKIDLKIFSDDQWEKLEKDAVKGTPKEWKSGDFLKFVHCLVTYPVKNTDGKIIRWDFDPERYKLLRKNIGYMVHTYKDPLTPKATVFYDSTGSAKNAPEGGTGKSLLLKTLGYVRNLRLMEGKNIKQDREWTFEGIELDHQVVVLDDVEDDFDFRKLFGILTTSLHIKRKYQREITVPFENCPKFAICSNHALIPKGKDAQLGTSDTRRQSVLELSSFFSEKDTNGQRINDRNKVFNNGTDKSVNGRKFWGNHWDEREWNIFYNWMFRSVQLYITDQNLEDVDELEARGIIFEDTKRKQLKQSGVDVDVQEWMKNIIRRTLPQRKDKEISKEHLWVEYKKYFGVEPVTPNQDEIDQRKFKESFFKVCDQEKVTLRKTGNANRYIKKGKDGKSTEYFSLV